MTTLATRFISRVIFPLHERLKGHGTTRILRQLETTQWWPAERLAEFQAARLRRLIKFASQQVPYYRKLFTEAGISPNDIRSPEDLPKKLPLLTKDLIRANIDALKADNTSSLIRFNTGGSTGEPLIFYLGKERVSHDVAAKWRATRWWGVDIGDPEVVVWGSPVELGAQNRLRAWRDRLLRTRLLSAFEMSERNLNYFIAEIRRLRPKMLFGYPSALAHMARHAQKRGVPMNDLGIQVAFVTAERLYDDQRRCIEAAFGCQVANGYGGRDAGFVAHQCPAGGMHVTAEDMVVELIDREGKPVGAGEPGEVVVTHLATREFPFIRYRTGDVAVFDNQPCSCGRSLPVLKEVQGRTTDFIVASDGTVMHGLALIYVLRNLPGIEAFKIVQEEVSIIRVLVVPTEDFEESTEATIRQGFRNRLGESVQVFVERRASIPPEASGKFRYVVSNVVC